VATASPQASAFDTPTPAPTGTGPANPIPAAWTRIEATNAGPAARYDHSLLLDPVREQLVVFGGRGTATFGDTWLFDLATRTWREVEGPGPEPRFGQGVVYDAAHRRMLLVMGEGAGFFNDAWAFDLDGETWTQLKANRVADDEPRPRYGQSAALDNQGRVFISHGFSDQGRFDDTWVFDPATARWTKLDPAGGVKPLKRCLHEIVYDSAADRMLLYGGCSSGFGPCPQGDLWAFDMQTQTWTELAPAGPVPAPRSNPSLVYDGASKRLLLYGGKTAEGASGESWRYDLATNTWARFENDGAPGPRSSQGTAGDRETRRAYLFGGQTPAGPTTELWAWQF
jgi:hypothetical protein